MSDITSFRFKLPHCFLPTQIRRTRFGVAPDSDSGVMIDAGPEPGLGVAAGDKAGLGLRRLDAEIYYFSIPYF